MIRKTTLITAALLLGGTMLCNLQAHSADREIYISPRGNDRSAGTIKAPMRTLQSAIDRAAASATPSDKLSIVMLGGRYDIDRTICVDSTWRGAQLTIRNHGDQKVIISGGRSVALKSARKVSPSTSKSAYERIQPEFRDSILEIDASALGIKLSDARPSGFGRPSSAAWSELFINGEPMQLSRWPNDSTVLIGEVLCPGTGENLDSTAFPVFKYKEERPKAWANAGEFWISGYFAHGYAHDMIRARVDTTAHAIFTSQHTVYGFMSGAAWRQWTALNLLEELDRPGEWVLDAAAGKVYFFAPREPVSSIDISLLEGPMMAIEGCSNVLVKGITFEYSRDMGIYMENSNNAVVDGCTIRNIGGVALSVGRGSASESKDIPKPHAAEAGGTPHSRVVGDLLGKVYQDVMYYRNSGTNNGIRNSYIYNVGSGGVSLGGGDRATLVPSGNFAENCKIHDYNRIEKSYRPGVWMDGVGCRVTACDIYNAPSMAILFHGNDHMIEYCKITNVCSEVDDQGAIYYGRDPAERGNTIRYCYFRELSPRHRVTATYHDDGACAGEVYGNIYYKAGSLPVLIGGGHDNTYKNNIFIDSPVAIHIDNRMQNWGAGMLAPGGIVDQRLREARYNEPPYSTAYPLLVSYWENDPTYPRNNIIEGNLFYKIGNLMSGQTQWGDFSNNWITRRDPGFVDPNDPLKGFKADAEVFRMIKDFPQLPFDKIGCTLP